MHIYLPVAGVSENILVLLALGGGIGVLSGLFGVGGGFLLTPFLIMLGIPPAVAVGSGANQVLGASVSGMMAHWRRRNVDVRMGVILLIGGLVGSSGGVYLFAWLKAMGQIELIINLSYVLLLGLIGGLMAAESGFVLFKRKSPTLKRRKLHQHSLLHRLPLKMRFPRSRLYISIIPPALVGVAVGVMSALMGVGGGFIMVPAMIYFLQMPAEVVIGTSLFQIVFVTANVTFMQAVTNQAVDVVLAIFLLVGGVVGAQVGAQFGRRLNADQMRFLLALMVLGMAVKLAFDITLTPADFYNLASRLD
ncbi:MAG: permease [Rhodospirillaceae bacterium BRH_c57]|nr:MAG: permease [Rhodospirillaceae bacterium BRH_c57]